MPIDTTLATVPRQGRGAYHQAGPGAYPESDSEPEPDEEDEMARAWEVQSLFHFVLNVSNFERSLAFYQKLGFRVLRDNRDVVWPPMVAENFGMRVAQGRGALLGIGDGPDHTRIDLIEWLEPRWRGPDVAPGSGRDAQRAGGAPTGDPADDPIPRVIALRTRNVRAAYAELSAQGIEFLRPPRERDPRVGIESIACCRDPDGTIIELIEYMDGRLGSRIDLLERRS